MNWCERRQRGISTWRVLAATAIVLRALSGHAGAQDVRPAAAAPPSSTTQPAPRGAPPEGDPATVAENLERAVAALRIAEKDEEGKGQAIDEAGASLQKALNADPTNPRARYLEARWRIQLGRGSQALAPVEAYTKTREGMNDWEAFRILADLQYQGTAWHLAKGNYEKAAALNSNDPRVFVGLAACNLQLGQREDAVKNIEKAVRLAPDDPDVMDGYVRTLLKINQVDTALDAAFRALALAETRVRRQTTVRSLQSWVARHGTLDEVLAEVVKRNPARGELYVRMSQNTQSLGEVSRVLAIYRALEFVNRGIEATAGKVPSDLYLERARLCIGLRRYDDAERALKEVDAIDPTNPAAAKLREGIERPQSQPAAGE